MTALREAGADARTSESNREGAHKLIVRVGRDILMIAGAAGSAQLVAFAAAPLVTRLYDPDDFGRFALFGAAIVIIYPLATLRYEFALPLPDNDETALDLLGLCLGLIAGFGAILTVLVWLAASTLSGWTGLSVLEVWLLPPGIVAYSLNGVAISWLGRRRTFAALAGVRFASTVGVVASQLVLGLLLHGGVIGLILGSIIGQLGGLLVGMRSVGPALASSLDRLGARRLRRVAAEYRSFSAITAPSNVIDGLGSQLPNLALPALYGPWVAGQFALAQRVLAQPTALIGRACNQVFWGNAPRLLADDPSGLKSLFFTLNGALFAAMLPALALVWLGPDIFALVFGAAWREAGVFAGLLVIASVLHLPAHATTSLHVYRLNHWLAGWEILRCVLAAVTLTVAAVAQLSPFACVAALSLALGAANAALLALNAVAVRRAGALHNAAPS